MVFYHEPLERPPRGFFRIAWRCPGKRSVCWAGRRTKCWRRKPCPRRMLCCCAPKTIRARSAVRAGGAQDLVSLGGRRWLCGGPALPPRTPQAKPDTSQPAAAKSAPPLAGRFFIVSYRFTASPFPQRYCLRSRRAALFSPARLRLSSPFAANRSSPA